MLARRFRLTKSIDFRRVHAEGRSWANRHLVLFCHSNDLHHSRFGFSVSKRIGNAVLRNRVKRLLREAIRSELDLIRPGWDVVIVARKGIAGADYEVVERSCSQLLSRARLFRTPGSVGFDEQQA